MLSGEGFVLSPEFDLDGWVEYHQGNIDGFFEGINEVLLNFFDDLSGRLNQLCLIIKNSLNLFQLFH